MNGKSRATASALALSLLAGCHARSTAPTVNYTMTQIMEPNAQIAWDTASKAFNDKGDALDAAKLSAADWSAVGKAGQQIRDGALALANAGQVIVAGSNESVLGAEAAGIKGRIGKAWDAASARQIQERIDRNPKLFAQHAKDLSEAGAAFVRAAANRDAALFYQVSSGLDETCDGCHEPFWGTDEPPPFALPGGEKVG